MLTISWDKPYKQKYVSIIKTEYVKFGFNKNSLGWDLHLGIICITYDDFGKVKKKC